MLTPSAVLRLSALAGLFFLIAGCNDNSGPPAANSPPPAKTSGSSTTKAGPGCPSEAESRVVRRSQELIGGSEVARGAVGDVLMENDRIRLLIRKPGRQHHGTINPYGGTVVDADICRDRGGRERSNFENTSLGVNIETIPHYTDVVILNDGQNGEPAVVRATGPLDLFEYANPSSVIVDMGLEFPESADDRPLPVMVQTDYILATGDQYLTEETTLFNESGEALDIYLVEYLSGSGFVDTFVPGMGFGEPLATTSCPVSNYVPCEGGTCDPCNFLGYIGFDGGQGVSYARIHPYQGSSAMNVTGINVIAYGQDILPVLLGLDSPNFTIPANGTLLLERYFAVTGGSVNSLQAVRNDIFGFSTGTLSGTITDTEGRPVSGAMVAVTRDNTDLEEFALAQPDLVNLASNITPERVFSTGSAMIGNLLDGQLVDGSVGTALAPEMDVISQDVTDASGRYHFELSPGEYDVRVYKPAHGAPLPELASLQVKEGSEGQQDFQLPEPGRLQVTVTDEKGRPMPAKIQLVGFEPNPPVANRQNLLGQVASQAGVFFDQFVRDPLPGAIAFVDFVGRQGVLETTEVPPGEYELVVSRGPRYSAWRERITIPEGGLAEARARIARVVETPGFISADFHVHGVDSLDARISRQDRILTYLSEGVDFFTPSDHGFQVDFREDIARAGVSDLIGTAPSAEVTTMDYGHFNAWPRTSVSDQLSGGYTDWGWGQQVPPGQRFPVFGNYLKSPREIIALGQQDPLTRPIVQINHMDSYFRETGLGIDSGQMPPQSTVDPGRRRLDPTLDNAFAGNFDALELWIGVNGRDAIDDDNGTILENLADWFNMINQGLVHTGVASSDTHTRRLTAMSARSMVASDVTNPGRLSEHAQVLADNVREGRVLMTNAPFVTVTAEAASTGESASLGLGLPLNLRTRDGVVTLTITIASPAWAEFDRVDLFINNAPAQTSEDPPRYAVCEDHRITLGVQDIERVTVVPGLDGAERLEATVTHQLEGLTEDAWVVARVAGTQGQSEPLFPVEPNSLEFSERNLDSVTGSNIGQGGVMAYALTNPLFIDVDGGGWQPGGVRQGECEAQETNFNPLLPLTGSL